MLYLAALKVNTKNHVESLIKSPDASLKRAKNAEKDRDAWRTRVNQMARGILPVLRAISPEAPEVFEKQGLVDTCQRSTGWFRQFMRDAGDFVGARVLSMVRTHYPRADLNRFLLGYPAKVGPNRAAELRNELHDLSLQLLRDVDLSGLPAPQPQGRPADAAGSSSSGSMPSAAVSTSQPQAGHASLTARPPYAVSSSHAGVATSSTERPDGQGGAQSSTGPRPPTS